MIKKENCYAAMTAVIMRNVYNGSVSICDIPTKLDDGTFDFRSKYRVILSGIPLSKTSISKGRAVNIVAGVNPHGIKLVK